MVIAKLECPRILCRERMFPPLWIKWLAKVYRSA
jgi:hypothetical protein